MEGKGRLPKLIMEALHIIGMAIPAWIHDRLSIPFRPIAVGVVAKDISRVVQDNIQYDVDAVGVSCPDECSQIISFTKMGIDIQKILNAVTMIRFLK